MSKRSAPYRHKDGSTCWTDGCRRGNFFVGQSAVTFTVKDFYSDVQDSEYVEALASLHAILDASSVQTPKLSHPAALTPLRSGAELNADHTFRNRLQAPYDPAAHGGVQNLAGDDFSWTKPRGAFWVSTVREGKLSEWDRLWGSHKEAKANAGDYEHEVKFKDDAKVLVIDSLADYEALLDRYPHYSRIELDENMLAFKLYGSAFSVFSSGGKVRRGLDWEVIAEDHDALMLTNRGYRACGGGDYMQQHAPASGDISLYSWDFESAVVFHPSAVSVSPL